MQEELTVRAEFLGACRAACNVEPELRANAHELYRYACQHERLNKCISNVAEQLAIFERKLFKQGARRPIETRKADRRKIIATAAVMFMRAIKVHRDQQNMSRVAVQALRSRDTLKRDVAAVMHEVPSEQESHGSPEEDHR